ncbi:hypothetical protein DL546_000750 [Coniochaeta pulveracea]|uniref:Uncharacterized protein n=1 Tax=Coniochaeta pulveracea TaxID=177199 RepID=A0A420YJ75_9PEZI|nr:hypothetical protein DL546_000750 [Coniochaeta pulveracea]
MSQSTNAQPAVAGSASIAVPSPGLPSWLKQPGGAAQEPETYHEFGHVGDEMKRLHDQIQDSHHTVSRTWRLAARLKGASILEDHNYEALVNLADILSLNAAHPDSPSHARSLLQWQVIQEEFKCFEAEYLDTLNSWKGDHEDPCWRHVDFMVRQGDKQRKPQQTLPDFYQMNPKTGCQEIKAIQWLWEEKLVRTTNSREWMFYHVLMFLHMQERAQMRARTHWLRKGWWEIRRLPVWRTIENSASYRKNELKQGLQGFVMGMVTRSRERRLRRIMAERARRGHT